MSDRWQIKVAVELTKKGKGRMMFTVGIGGRIPGILKSTEGTDMIIAIDGCSLFIVQGSHWKLQDLQLIPMLC